MDSFLGGAIGGIVECLCVQPFDIIKTRFQLSSGASPPILSAFKAIYSEGGVSRFYRGILPEMAGMIPKNATQFGVYDVTRQYLEQKDTFIGPSIGVEFLSALACSTPEAAVFTPFQVVKVRLQSKEHLGKYTNTAQAFSTIIKEEGFVALSIGLKATVFRNSVWNCVYFPTMFVMKDLMSGSKSENSSQLQDTLRSMVGGFVGGCFATCFNCPFDVLKSRAQVSVRGSSSYGVNYDKIFSSLIYIAKTEGIKGMYKGFTPKVLRMGIGGGVSVAAFEITQKWAKGVE